MPITRIRTTRLENVGQVAAEHAFVFRRLKQGKLDPALASRMSAILVNHRTILETQKAEAMIEDLTRQVEELKAAAGKGIRRVALWPRTSRSSWPSSKRTLMR